MWRTRTPTPTFSMRRVPVSQLLKWAAGHLPHKATDVGPVAQNFAAKHFLCGDTQPGKLRLGLARLLAVLEGREKKLVVHQQRGGDYLSSEPETAVLLKEVQSGIIKAMTARRDEDRLSDEELGMLFGEFHARNRNGNDPDLMTFLGVVEQKLAEVISDPIDLYVGASIAFRRRATIANVNEYTDAVSRKFRISSADERLTLAARVAFAVIDRGQFDPALLIGMIRHNRFDAAQSARLAAHVFRARGESSARIENHIHNWFDRAGYGVEQTASLLAELAGELGYGAPQAAKLITDVAKRKNYRSADALDQLTRHMIIKLDFKGMQSAEFISWLTHHGFFQLKRG